MAAPQFLGAVETGVNQGNAAVSIDAPSGVSAGDYQLVVVSLVTDSSDFGDTPAGWTRLTNTITFLDSGEDFRTAVYESTTETGPFTMTNTGSRVWHALRMAWTLPDGSAGRTVPLATNQTGPGTSHPVPSVTTTAPDSVIVGVGTTETINDPLSWTDTGTMTEIARQDARNTIERLWMVAAETQRATPGGGSPGTFTTDVSWQAQMFAVVIDGVDDGGSTDPPGSVFDLANWKITLPTEDPEDPGDADEVRQPELNTYADEHFYLDGSDRMVMVAPTSGPNIETTGGSSASRCELREMQGENEAAWSIFDTEPRSLTVTGTFDPTSITGGSNPRKEMIIGQVHGPLGNPPIYLAAEFHVATPRVRVYKYNGSSTPGFGNMLEGLTPTSTITYRIEYDPGADPVNGTGRINIYGAFGTVDNLPTEPDFAFAPGDFFDQTDEWYFKAGAYNKTTVASGSTGAAVATISYLELVQPAGGTAHELDGAAGVLAAGTGTVVFDEHAEHELDGDAAALAAGSGAVVLDEPAVYDRTGVAAALAAGGGAGDVQLPAEHELDGAGAALAAGAGALTFDPHAEHQLDGAGAALAAAGGVLQFDEHTEHDRSGAAAALAGVRGTRTVQTAGAYERDGQAAALAAGTGAAELDEHEVSDRAGAAAALAGAAGAVELDTVNIFTRAGSGAALVAATGEGDQVSDRTGAAAALAAGSGAVDVSHAATHERVGASAALVAGNGLGNRSSATEIETAGSAAALVHGSGTVTVTGPTTYELAGGAAAVPVGRGHKERVRSYGGSAAAVPAGTGAGALVPPAVHVRGGDGVALAVGSGLGEHVEVTVYEPVGSAGALAAAAGTVELVEAGRIERDGAAAALGAAAGVLELDEHDLLDRTGAGVALAAGRGLWRIGGVIRIGTPYRVGTHRAGQPVAAGTQRAGEPVAVGAHHAGEVYVDGQL